MLGGAWFQEVIGTMGEAEVTMVAQDTVSKVLGIEDKPVRTYARILPNCIAQYTVGHKKRVNDARKIIGGLGVNVSLVGSSYDGVGINDSIMSARKALIL